MQSSITHFKAWKKGKVWLYSASLITFLLLGAVTTQLAKADESTASPLTSLNSLTPNSLDASACSCNSETSEISTVSSVISSTPQISDGAIL
ncbi:KxYKxGKxW signal peptide domain-containing protein [Lactococcus lactis]|uniref:KxYKxGKxW signal peptide domain-containing protein n=1 Tax=Lactococcus lactis TaxID=1358 RepID=UPI002890BC58|nr:KxYKxGKxW signal peptide domain-containing protein [Lactococcus lactis]MDT2880753.1 KxYKxGKxW signal peptide domain-containing protein [Lactococcus lactis]